MATLCLFICMSVPDAAEGDLKPRRRRLSMAWAGWQRFAFYRLRRLGDTFALGICKQPISRRLKLSPLLPTFWLGSTLQWRSLCRVGTAHCIQGTEITGLRGILLRAKFWAHFLMVFNHLFKKNATLNRLPTQGVWRCMANLKKTQSSRPALPTGELFCCYLICFALFSGMLTKLRRETIINY